MGQLGRMHRAKKASVSDLNQHLTCKLCKGYFIDATTIIECLHSFCRSCIVKYLETNKYCPVCDVQVHKTKPLLNIRPDRTLQDVVYKLVPRLLQNEIQRRKEFVVTHPEVKPNFEQWGETNQHLLIQDESVSLALSYYGCKESTRYLRCPTAVSVTHLQRLVKAKYGLTDSYHVDIFYNHDCLNPTLTLMDVAYIYSWKRKSPLDLSYRVYEYAVKKLKVEDKTGESVQTNSVTTPNNNNNNNNNWKEVQLRISENGEMSITGIQDDTVEIVNNNNYKSEVVVDNNKVNNNKKELPELLPQVNRNNNGVSNSTWNESSVVSAVATSCASLSNSATTKTVYSTINASKCSVSSDSNQRSTGEEKKKKNDKKDEEKQKNRDKKDVKEDLAKLTSVAPVTTTAIIATTTTLTSNTTACGGDKGVKRKLDPPQNESTVKHQKQTILNHSLGLHNLSNNHPLKKHAQLNKSNENLEKPAAESGESIFPKPTSYVNKSPNTINANLNRPGTPITPKSPPSKPCYMPKPPIINVPKPSTNASKNDLKAQSTCSTVSKNECRTVTAVATATTTTTTPASQNQNKINVKNKPGTPIGYKTLRDPPKSWNSQIARANLNKPVADPKYSDLKNVRPAKFFKMRNNLPRYLGNPSSGVKPMYQVHVSPDKDKEKAAAETAPNQKPPSVEIKKHSIVKIDPKTLKPISEKAPETTSLSNSSSTSSMDLKINTSSVSIFNPLKLQNSPKNERRSPKSPHSPKPKNASPTTATKRDKLNLNFTPPNPFIPNLASPTVSPNQFLYPAGAGGFPPYDPRVMAAAYHNFLYSQRMAFPTGLNLDLNQRKNFDLPGPTSPKLGPLPQPLSPQQGTMKIPSAEQLSLQSLVRLSNSSRYKQPSPVPKKNNKESTNKTEKSLQNAVEKLTQNRVKEIKNEAVKTEEKKTAQEKVNCDNQKKDDKNNKKEENKTTERKTESDVEKNKPVVSEPVTNNRKE